MILILNCLLQMILNSKIVHLYYSTFVPEYLYSLPPPFHYHAPRVILVFWGQTVIFRNVNSLASLILRFVTRCTYKYAIFAIPETPLEASTRPLPRILAIWPLIVRRMGSERLLARSPGHPFSDRASDCDFANRKRTFNKIYNTRPNLTKVPSCGTSC